MCKEMPSTKLARLILRPASSFLPGPRGTVCSGESLGLVYLIVSAALSVILIQPSSLLAKFPNA